VNDTRFQFGIRRLLVLLLMAVAVVTALAVRSSGHPAFRAVLAAYFILIIGWAVMRLPTVWRSMADVRRRSRRLKHRRSKLEKDTQLKMHTIEKAKQQLDPNEQSGAPPS
jgi:hypothetical protein